MKYLILGLLALTLSALAGCHADNTSPSPPGGGHGEPMMCTQEAKMCPDGSYVGRTGAHCAFAACPDGSQPQ